VFPFSLSEGNQQLVRFIVVGTVGFVVDGGTMAALMWFAHAPLLWRVPSFVLACFVTWKLNSVWTFGQTGTIWKYFAVQSVGAALNYAVFAMVILLFGSQNKIVMFAFVLGSLTALVWNFLGAKRFVFYRSNF
jgi:putative flippase GtrA